MPAFKDLTNKKFGKLLILERANSRRQQCGKLTTYWKCKCDCGNIVEIRQDSFTSTISCKQCKKKIKNMKLYLMLRHMKERCYNISDKEYKNYGGRGIKICDEWLDEQNGYNNFYNWAINNGFDFNLKKYDCTIDRINVDGNYEPSNCRFVPNYIQAKNKRNNVYVEFNGKKQILADWAKEFKMKPNIFRYRYLQGWSIEKIKNTPVRSRNKYERRNIE